MGGRGREYSRLFEQGLKRCTRCSEIKPLAEFSPRSNFKGDTLPRANCKPCCSKVTVERREEGYGRIATLRKYGLTPDTYNVMVNEQNGRCAICKEVYTPLFVDHDHETNEIRGLLCFHCNTALGHFEDKITNLEAAINYLQERKG